MKNNNDNRKCKNILHFHKRSWTSVFFNFAIGACIALSSILAINQDAMAQAKVIDIHGNVLDEGTGQSVDPRDSLALVAFYHDANGETWLDNSGWLVDMVEFWVGIRLIEEVNPGEWRVTEIQLPRGNMTETATIAPEIGELEYLTFLDIRNNIWVGQIPPEIGKLTRMRNIQIQGGGFGLLSGDVPWDEFGKMNDLFNLRIPQHFFSGVIPQGIGGMSSLERLDIASNQFSGQFPQEALQQLGNFRFLQIQNNLFTGEIPRPSPDLDNFGILNVNNNPFTPGPIPDWIQDYATTLGTLDIRNSNRTGGFPAWIADLENMTRFHVGEHGDYVFPDGTFSAGSQGDLGGDIPDLSFLPNLVRVDLEGAGFTGQIQSFWGEMAALERFHVSRTNYEGSLPENLSTQTSLDQLRFTHNPNLTGGIPASYQQLTGVSEFNFNDNANLGIGEMPVWLSNLTNIRGILFSNSGLTGTIPSEWSSLDRVSNVDLSYNEGVTGGIPNYMSQRDDINNWNLSYTSMDVSEIPAFLNSVTNLQSVQLAGLGITGEIPTWLIEGGNRPFSLRTLNFADNELTGTIPASIGDLGLNMSVIDFSNNQLSGELPENIANAGRFAPERTNLSVLKLSGNADLAGALPANLVHANEMRVIEYEGTQICEPNDAGLITWLEETVPANEFTTFPNAYISVSRTNTPCGTGTAVNHVELPNRLHLYQNYPNPFNPTTSIKFDIPENMDVTLGIYNILGQHVVTLVDGQMDAGSHQMNFDAAQLSSGTYIYRLKTNDRVMTQTMMLIK